LGDPDITESPGCQAGNNNFVKELDMESGKSYVLVVNNFSRSGLGFAIEFGGTGTFLGPKPDFEINANQAFECDKSVIFTNTSDSQTDPIVSYTWNFGDRAVPDRASGLGPYDVVYQSFGGKIAALTVESSRGCRVTKIKDFYVDACCKDTSTLSINALAIDLRCFEIPEGRILAQGLRGAPEYSYSLDGSPFRPNPQYGNLSAGTYDLAVQDIKGCKDTIEVIINQPPPIIVDAGPDKEIELGDTTIITLNYTPIKDFDIIAWDPDLSLLKDLDFSGRPFVTTNFTVTVVDSNGCVGTDIVQVRVVKNLKLHAPNVFTPFNGDGINDFFNVWVSKGVDFIELLEIYDRWGNLVFQGVDGVDFNRNDFNSGWDGIFKGQKVNPGVFVWRAGVRWLDGTFSNYAGDVTVIR
jgi:gliding motility-associated-like protein